MDIKTKFSVGDSCWTMLNNRPLNFTVRAIEAKVSEQETSIRYRITNATENDWVNENDCFGNRDSLIYHLFKD